MSLRLYQKFKSAQCCVDKLGIGMVAFIQDLWDFVKNVLKELCPS